MKQSSIKTTVIQLTPLFVEMGTTAVRVMGKYTAPVVTRLRGAETPVCNQSRSNINSGELEVVSPSGLEMTPAE